MIVEEEAYLAHYGILRKSGRYPWGSGGNPSQRSKSFFDYIQQMKDEGLTEPEIARGLDMSTTELRKLKTLARNQKKAADIAMATRLKEKGYSNVAIGKRMGNINESSVRSLLAPGQKEKTDILGTIANMLRDEVDEKGAIDVGKGNENHIGVSKERLATAVSILEDEGYVVHSVQVPQLGTGGQNKTTIKVLAKPGTTYRDLVSDISQIKSLAKQSENHGRSFFGLLPPISVDPKRIKVAYEEDGGAALDGVIYVRPGKNDLSLGGARYAQVRIMVNGTHYMKGMAMYKTDLPPGVDLVFNTNKKKSELGSDKLAALKKITDDPDNPFGAVVKQIGNKNEKDELVEVTSAMNLVNKEGDWDKWKNTISSQVLSKQSPILAKTQLDQTYAQKKADLDEIMSLTNPSIRKKLLESYADEVDSSAVHLKAAALPRQRSQVILPINSLKENEIYAPNFRNGERVALIRYPHGGTFEIPELIVNNNHPEAKAILGPGAGGRKTAATDAVAINSKVAERLSGADFDGDSVLVIPNPITNPKLKTTPALEGLKGFDPQSAYPGYDGMKPMDSQTKGQQMGLVSNLITDMTIQKANTHELAAAVRHSMVVIDAEKHKLNYKQSAIDNGIPHLMEKYQGRKGGGASTLISRATSRKMVKDRVPRPMSEGGPVDPATGKRVWKETGKHYIDPKTGRPVYKLKRSVKLAETDDARTLLSKDGQGTPIEKVYADHSNKLKALANQARKAAVNTAPIKRNPSAAKVFANEEKSLTAKLKLAQRNAPLERQAQVLANTIKSAKLAAAPDTDHIQRRRIEAQALNEARLRMGAKKPLIDITDDEWKAIQAGAISPTKLKHILDNSDLNRVKQLATPKTPRLMTSSKMARAKSMINAGYTQAEIADALGVSLTTLKEELKDG